MAEHRTTVRPWGTGWQVRCVDCGVILGGVNGPFASMRAASAFADEHRAAAAQHAFELAQRERVLPEAEHRRGADERVRLEIERQRSAEEGRQRALADAV